MKRCSLDGCTLPHLARGWCKKHYYKGTKYGDPLAGRQVYSSPEASFAARTERKGGCLVWTGNTAASGYGRVRINGVYVGAHRYAWQRVNGPIPPGMVVDHICHNPACVDVDHLRLATTQQNARNRAGADRGSRSGIRNVHRVPSGRYQVHVTKDRVNHYGGTFDSIHEAESAAISLRKSLHGEFAS